MLASNFSVSTQHFYAFYLLSHGIVKLALVVALLKNKLWAYPSSLIVLGLFEHTAAETNFYSVKRPDGEYIDLIEDWLAEIESAAALRDFKI
ncbi:hypothetical protein MesoLj113b_66750 [Mesorhizobium sp. 113-3-3]|nr:hypothetical protein MesoLj113b_66750 [Mesorhizobium sp. 113-3-3]